MTEKLLHLDPRDIQVIEGRNSRFDYGNIDELADSIKANGMKQPVKVQIKDDCYHLVDGHRRLKACMQLVSKGFIPDVLAMAISSDITEDEILSDMIISNDGKHFSPLEEAMMLQKLRDTFKWSQNDIAKKIGKSLSHVSNRIALLNADDSIKEALVDGTLKTQEALAIVRKSNGDKEAQKEIVKRTKSGETGVVNKELLKGRFNAEQKEVIYVGFKSLELYEVESKDFEKYENSDNPEVMQAFCAGVFQGYADLAFTSMEDLFEKIKIKVNQERANSIIPVEKSKVVKTAVKEEPKAKSKSKAKAKKEELNDE